MHEVTEILISWYRNNKRDLPWRSTSDPYRIWLSEVILQQTRVSQGLSYYYRFLDSFPDIQSLADATEEEVLKVWQGLGYYSRARNLHHTARVIANESGGIFPGSYQGLLKLKGIGEYTAAAIASIAYNEVVAVVDGNVARVIARLFGIHDAVNSTNGKKILKLTAQELISQKYPAEFNQAIMEFGALFCKPSNPDCPDCVLKVYCQAYQKGEVSLLPVKKAKRSARDHYMYYLVMERRAEGEEKILIRRRSSQGIWKNLYDFPAIEHSASMEMGDVLKSAEQSNLLEEHRYTVKAISPTFTHQLTHVSIKAMFIKIIPDSLTKPLDSLSWVNKQEIFRLPVSRLIENYLSSFE